MARRRVWASFAATLGVIALLVGLSLMRAGAQTNTISDDTTRVAYLPVTSLTKKEFATVHVVNVGTDQNAPVQKFTVMFADVHGLTIQPEATCEVRSGETCAVTLQSSQCGAPDNFGVCPFRVVIVADELPCVASTDSDAGHWLANIELFSSTGNSKYVAGDSRVLKLPITVCNSPDQASPDAPFQNPDAPAPDEPLSSPDAPLSSPDAPLSSPDAPLSSPDAPLSSPDAPLSSPDAPLSSPDAPLSSPDAPLSSPDAPLSSPDAPLSSPDAPLLSALRATSGTARTKGSPAVPSGKSQR